ncbi:S1 family peptidase [Streptomyces actinomycinicus]|uniref:S1 family peptidase n=1 Tax=Streptomyces actinomycinicus TaxID=1695166 RepID=A0A937EKJ0_9ACTN|nr:S1 family peptidase [Streptomyces actinomycinicus]MBL1083750.1 S1 family peptidase [Streptomyces actinomycinicus]
MRKPFRHSNSARSLLALLLAGLALIPQPSASAEPPPEPEGHEVRTAPIDELSRGLGLDRAAVRRLLADEEAAAATQRRLVPRLGSSYGGSWYDRKTRRLTVAVTDPALSRPVSEAGARVKVVKHSRATLAAVQTELDDRARRDPSAAAGLAGWHVDEPTNTVVVDAVEGRPAGAVLKAARAHGAAVRVKSVADDLPRLSAAYLDGGETIIMPNLSTCSVGFNARMYTNSPVMITAGHCADGGGPVVGFNGRGIGPWWFADRTYDWGVTAVDTTQWEQGPWISRHTPDDSVYLVHGSFQAPVGTSVCKSGITTKVTCGIIRWRNETVPLDNGKILYGMTRNTTCQEPGDSGGPYFSGGQAQGVATAARYRRDNDHSPWLCLSKYGLENVSWYQEINYILGYTGARLLVD